MIHQNPTKERTLVIIKPDGVQRSLIGEVIKRYERVGLKLIAIKMIIPNLDQVKNHYMSGPDWLENVGKKMLSALAARGEVYDTQDPIEIGQRVLMRLQTYLSSGPVIAMVWQGAHAVDVVRKITGGTEPRTSDIGTIRGDFMHDSYMLAQDIRAVRNIVHASGTIEEAEKEITVWFDKEELVSYRLVQEEILYDVNMDGTKE